MQSGRCSPLFRRNLLPPFVMGHVQQDGREKSPKRANDSKAKGEAISGHSEGPF